MKAFAAVVLATSVLAGPLAAKANDELTPWDKVKKATAAAAVFASKQAVSALPKGVFDKIANKGYVEGPNKAKYPLSLPGVLVPGQPGAAAAGDAGRAIKTHVDLRGGLPGIRDQGNRDTSVAFAAVAAMEYALRNPHDLSEQYAYWMFKNAEKGDARCHGGASIFDAAKLLSEEGVPVESAWTYETLDPRELFRKDCFHKETWSSGEPPKKARSAPKYHIKSYSVIHDAKDVAQLLLPLDAGHPVVFATGVAGTHWHEWTYLTKIIDIMVDAHHQPVEAKYSQTILLVGYDLKKNAFLFRNSWGYRWGKEGYHWLAFDYVKHYGLGAWYINEVAKK